MTHTTRQQLERNVKATQKIAKLHDLLLTHHYPGHDSQLLLARILFCLFAEHHYIFQKNAFLYYIKNTKNDGSDLAIRLNLLFGTLNLPPEKRKIPPALSSDLQTFPHINCELFTKNLPLTDFNHNIRQSLIDCCYFNWQQISLDIFGSMLQSIMNPDKRRELGAHYTSEEVILKLLKPLFLDELQHEFEQNKTNRAGLKKLQKKLANLKILDPACGCGNFLVITYRELRRLELEILKLLYSPSKPPTKKELTILNNNQFYGIEIEDFPCQIARVSMWLVDHLMHTEACQHFGLKHPKHPKHPKLSHQNAHIICGNALRIDWQLCFKSPNNAQITTFDYIIGNPPFHGARMMNKAAKSDLQYVFGHLKNLGNLDYVTAWYWKTAQLIYHTKTKSIRAAYISTSSITQGEQPAIFWQPMSEQYGITIDFAYQAFKWHGNTRNNAIIHCVIIGFSTQNTKTNKNTHATLLHPKPKTLYCQNNKTHHVKHINAYLVPAADIYIKNRHQSLGNAPPMGIGNKPVDNGYYLFTAKEKNAFLKIEAEAEKYFKPWIGAREYINNYTRYCLWLGDAEADKLSRLPECQKRIEAVKNYRLLSTSQTTQKLAKKPTHFHVENMPKSDFIVIPKINSIHRKYIPLGYLPPTTLASDLLFIITNASLYHFGILSSSVHMAWIRAVAGRLGETIRYSKNIVYNNFPWPESTPTQQKKITELSQIILNTRMQYANTSLANLYNSSNMPKSLLKAHQQLDLAVLKLYHFKPNPTLDPDTTQTQIVTQLMLKYKELTQKSYPD